MARYICPSCGAVYNGKKCSACFYERFGEVNPSRPRTETERPIQVPKNPAQKHRKKNRHPMLGFWVLLFVIYAFLPLFRGFGLELERREAARLQPDIDLPAQIKQLYQEGPVTVYTEPWSLEDMDTAGLWFWVQNKSQQELTVRIEELPQGGSVQLAVKADSWAMSTLYPERTDAREYSLRIRVTSESGAELFTAESISLKEDLK